MKKNSSVFLVIICFCALTNFAQIKTNGVKNATDKSFPERETMVILYEKPNYLNTFFFMKEGDNFLYKPYDGGDFASSISVPKGFVAIVYESLYNRKPFGISVDLMEDCPDLSVFKLDKKFLR